MGSHGEVAVGSLERIGETFHRARDSELLRDAHIETTEMKK